LSNNNLPKGVGRTFESCWAGQISRNNGITLRYCGLLIWSWQALT